MSPDSPRNLWRLAISHNLNMSKNIESSHPRSTMLATDFVTYFKLIFTTELRKRTAADAIPWDSVRKY